MYKQAVAGTLVSWHRKCHLQQHSISHNCFVTSFIIILVTVFTLLWKTTVFTAFEFHPWNMAAQSAFLWACKRHLHRWGGKALILKALFGLSVGSNRNFTSLDLWVLWEGSTWISGGLHGWVLSWYTIYNSVLGFCKLKHKFYRVGHPVT